MFQYYFIILIQATTLDAAAKSASKITLLSNCGILDKIQGYSITFSSSAYP